MGEGRGTQESGEGRGRIWRGGKWECTKKYPQNATCLAFGDDPWGLLLTKANY